LEGGRGGERLDKFSEEIFFALRLTLIQFALLFTYLFINHVLFQNFANIEFKIAILLFFASLNGNQK